VMRDRKAHKPPVSGAGSAPREAFLGPVAREGGVVLDVRREGMSRPPRRREENTVSSCSGN